MLHSIKIKNISIIDEIEIDFNRGLNIITGETGSGKSIFINAIQIIAGKKLSSDEILRSNTDCGEVEALLYWKDDEDIVVRRQIVKNGKGKVYINGKFASLNELKTLISNQIEFSGQNQNQSLFKKSEQLKFIDIFGKLDPYLNDYKVAFQLFKKVENNYKQLVNSKDKIENSKKEIIDDLEVLEKASLEDINEGEKLKSEIKYAENLEKIKNILNLGYYDIFDSENSVSLKLNEIKKNFLLISSLKETFKEISDIISEIEINLEEINKLILSEISNFNDIEISVDNLYERQSLINRLKKRFNKNSISELINLKNTLKHKLYEFESLSFDIEKLEKEKEALYNKLKEKGEILSIKRKEAAKKFEIEVKNHLKDLKMSKVDFKVSFKKFEDYSENGIDNVEYLIATNIGEPLKPLDKIVSGGELSRIMLALKTVLSDYLDIPVLIFDEVDSGTGGEVAFSIGKKLKEISKKHQVFAITHLPQVAAFSDFHYKIEKKVINNKTVSIIKKLNSEEQILEISRMLSGDNITEKAIENAKELIEIGKKYEIKRS